MAYDTSAAAALTSIRVLSYAMLGWALFYLAMSFGKWYEGEVLDDQLDYELNGDTEIRSSYNQRFLFIGMPIVLAAALGGVYEAIWKRRELRRAELLVAPEDGEGHTTENSGGGFSTSLHAAVHYKFRPLGQHAP